MTGLKRRTLLKSGLLLAGTAMLPATSHADEQPKPLATSQTTTSSGALAMPVHIVRFEHQNLIQWGSSVRDSSPPFPASTPAPGI